VKNELSKRIYLRRNKCHKALKEKGEVEAKEILRKTTVVMKRRR